MGKYCFIVNPVAGEGKAKEIADLIPNYLQEHEYHIRYSSAVGDASNIAIHEREKGTEVLVAVGGDGTINEVASALVNKNESLGIIPAGSGNGLARNLALPLDAELALRELLNGSDQSIDVGVWNERYFFNLMGVGLEAAVSKRFRDRVRRGFMGYAIDILNEYRNLRPYHFQLNIDGEKRSFEAIQMTLCLGPQYGNEAYVAPLKMFNNGQFQLVVLKELKLHRIPVVLPALFNQRFHELAEVETIDCHDVQFETNASHLHLDAEVFEVADSNQMRILPKSLKVRY